MNKTLKVVAGALLLAGMFTACNKNGGSTAVKSELDSVSMANGIFMGAQMQQSFQMSKMQGQEMDADEFLRGFKEYYADSAKLSYLAGAITAVQVGMEMQKDSLSRSIFMEYFERSLKNDPNNPNAADTTLMSQEKAYEILNAFQQKKATLEAEKQFGANRQKGKEALDKFAQEEGVERTQSGLAYKYLTKGAGKTPTAADTVMVDYAGTLIDGTEFDKGQDVKFGVTQVIPGWTEMLQLMKEGDKVKVYIPQELAYGERGQGQIEPFSTLVFEMTLKKVIPAKAQ